MKFHVVIVMQYYTGETRRRLKDRKRESLNAFKIRTLKSLLCANIL